MSTPDGRVGQLPAPPGIVPNFDHPRDVGHKANIIGLSVCCALSTFFVLIRAYVRIFVNRRIMVSDVTCLVGWIFTLIYAATALAMTFYGLGFHAYEVTPEDYIQVLKWLYAGSVVYIPAAYFVKVTLLLLIARVFAVEARLARGIYIFIFVLLFAYTPVQTLKTMICYPIHAYWDPIGAGNFGCINQRALFITDLCIAVITDLIIVILPIPVTWHMRLPLHKKIKIMFMLGAGGLATGVTFLRLVKCILFLKADDVTADFVILDMTTCVELTIGLVCACLPSAHFLYERWNTRHHRRSSNRPRTGRFSPKRTPSSWLSTMTRKTMRSINLTAVDGTTTVVQNNDDGTTTVIPTNGNGNGHPAPPMTQVHDGRATNIRGSTTDIMMKTCCRGGTANKACCDESRRQAQRRFNIELARFTGTSLDEDEDEVLPVGTVPSSRRASSRVTSFEGRREGWLAPKSEAGDVTDIEAASATPDGPQHPVRYWSTIWDGTQDDIPR